MAVSTPGLRRWQSAALVCAVVIGALVWDAFVPHQVVWAATVIVSAGIAYLGLRQRRRRRDECPDGGLYPDCHFRVTLDSGGVTCTHPGLSPEHVGWSDLVRFDVRTTSGGPWAADVWWILAASDGSTCSVPQGATGEQALLQCLLSLPGIDWEMFGAAMRSTGNRTFPCWSAEKPTGFPAHPS